MSSGVHAAQEYLDDRLTAGERALFEEHLASCDDCCRRPRCWISVPWRRRAWHG